MVALIILAAPGHTVTPCYPLTNILRYKIGAAYLPRARHRTGKCPTPDLDFREPPYESKLDREGPGLTVEGYPGPDLLVMSATHRLGQPED